MKKATFLLAIFLLQGCAGIFLGSTLSGAYLVSSFNSFSETKNEYLLKKDIKSDLTQIALENPNLEFDIDIIIIKDKIFAIGTAKNKASMEKPLNHIATKYRKYKLIDEIKLKYSINMISDTLLKTKIKTKLLLTNGIRFSNYYIAVFGEEVTIIGYSINQNEHALVLEKITQTSGVKSVLNYIEIKDLEE